MANKTYNRCPYTLELLSDLPEINDEHIFPDAIGGVKDYCVQASAKKNAELGTSLDAKLIECPLVAAPKTLHGIRSRSGAPSWSMRGTIDGTPTIIDLKFFTTGDVSLRTHNPFQWDESHTRATITVFPHEREKFIRDLLSNCARKAKEVQLLSEEKGGLPTVKVDMSFDLVLLGRAISKIAFLAVYKEFGDQFLSDPLVPHWHACIFSQAQAEQGNVKIHGRLFDSSFNPVFFPPLKPYEHAACVVNLGQQGPLVAVALFGGEFFTSLSVASETSHYGLRECEGTIAVCDAIAGRTRFMPFSEHVLQFASDHSRVSAFFASREGFGNFQKP